MLDIGLTDAPFDRLVGARGPPFCPPAPCASYIQILESFSSSKSGHGGARPNSGGARPNSGGPRANSGGARDGAGRPVKPRVELIPAEVPHWYGIRATRGFEMAADIAIRLAGIPLFAPTLFKAAVPAHRGAGGGYRPARIQRIEYLFWRTMFVRLNLGDPNWRDILELVEPRPDGGEDARAKQLRLLQEASDSFEPPRRVVEAFITSPGSRRPAAVSDRAIEEVRALLKPNGCLYPTNFIMVEDRRRRHSGDAIDSGTALRVLDGPLAGHDAVCDVSDTWRVAMRTRMFNRDVVAHSARAAVEAV